MSKTIRSRSRLALLAGALALAACSGGGSGGGGGGGGGNGTSDFLVVDAALDELLALRTTVSGLRLVSDAGIAGDNLLSAPVPIELLGTGLVPRWIARRELPSGTFRGVALAINPLSTAALDRSGALVAVTELSTSFECRFASPVTIDSNAYRQFVLDIDVAESISGSVAAPPLAFDPVGTAVLSTGGGTSSAIDEVKGIVQSFDTGDNSFVIDAFADGDATAPLGDVRVALQGATLILDETGAPFANVPAFFAALAAGTTVLEVHGTLDGGAVSAARVELEDNGIGAASHVVKIEGRIAGLSTGSNSFALEIVEIEKGASIALPVIGVSLQIGVSYSAATNFVIDGGTPTTEASLAEGQRVKVKFPTFALAPFPASQVEIEDLPEFEGRIQGVAGLPGALVIRLDSGEPAIASGQVASPLTDITVDISGSTLFLDQGTEPALAPDRLQPGLELELHGSISGPAISPTIVAARTRIHAGRFKGDVTAVFPVLHAFNATITDLKDPFGASVTQNDVTVTFDSGCVFEGEAASETAFYALFNGLAGGATLEVEVYGLGAITPLDEIDCFEIKSKVN